MTKEARYVLHDCELAHSRHTDDLQDYEFRLSWIALVTLLRAVGHVLDKVDGDSTKNPKLSKVIREKYQEIKKSRPEPIIFWKFIEEHRNNVIKMYKFEVSRGLEIKSLDADVPVRVEAIQAKVSSPNARFYSELANDHFSGRSEIEVLKEAIDWWKAYLDEIDKLADKVDE
jgi:hypothetical protein